MRYHAGHVCVCVKPVHDIGQLRINQMVTGLQVSPTRQSSHFGDGSKPYENMAHCLVHALLSAFAKFAKKGLLLFVVSVRLSRPHRATLIPMNGFSINL